jgi:thymidylate synthase
LDLKEVPCTTTLQFHLRKGLLHMSVTLRSNNAYWGLPHDVFCFTMLQEMMARRLGVELGEYYHYVGSMHIYEDFLDTMREYVAEGVQRTIEMPVMPIGDPFAMVDRLLDVERRLRAGETLEAGREMGNPIGPTSSAYSRFSGRGSGQLTILGGSTSFKRNCV